MKRLLKILVGLVAVLVLLIGLTAVLLPMIYDKEDLKAAIAAEVRDQTGRDLVIEGDLDFSVFPWLAVEVSELGLSNAEGFAGQRFAKVGQARVGVALLPLLRKKISIDEITLDGLELTLEVDEQGRSNWEDLASGKKTAAVEDSGPGIFSGQRVAGLNLRNANVEFRDRSTGVHYRLKDFSMQTGALGGNQAVPLELKAMLEDVTGGASAEVELAATAAVDMEAGQYDLDEFELGLTLKAGDGRQVLLLSAPRLELNLAAQTLQLDAFTAELASLKMNGALSASSVLDDPSFNGSLNVAEFSPRELMQSLELDVPATADPGVLQKAAFSANLSGGSSGFDLSDVVMALDQSRLNGEFSVRDFDQPAIGFTLAVDELDLDRYMAPASEDNGAAPGGATDVAMPREELQGMKVQGELRAGSLRMAGLEFNDAEVNVSVLDGRLRLSPLTAGFYGGRYNGDISLDGSGAVPVLSLDEKVDSITFQRLVSDLVDSEALSGMAQGHARLTGRGTTGSEVLGSLQGDLGLTLTEGALEGINIWYEIRRGMALYKRMPPPEPEPNRTVFSRMQLAADVAEGVIATRQLTGELPFLTVRGNGEIDLGQSQVDLGMVAEVRNAPELAQDPLAAELGGKSFPFRISGPLDAPSLSVDWEALLKSEAADMLLDQLRKRTKKDDEAAAESQQGEASSQDDLEETAKGMLFDLLGGKDKDKDKDKDGG